MRKKIKVAMYSFFVRLTHRMCKCRIREPKRYCRLIFISFSFLLRLVAYIFFFRSQSTVCHCNMSLELATITHHEIFIIGTAINLKIVDVTSSLILEARNRCDGRAYADEATTKENVFLLAYDVSIVMTKDLSIVASKQSSLHLKMNPFVKVILSGKHLGIYFYSKTTCFSFCE